MANNNGYGTHRRGRQPALSPQRAPAIGCFRLTGHNFA